MTAKFKVFCFLIAICLGFWTCEKTQSRQEGNESGSESLEHSFMINFSEHFQPATGITITDSALYHEGEGNLEIISNPFKSPFRLDVLNIVFTVKEKMTFDELHNSIEIYLSFSETGDDWSNWNRFKISHHEADYTQIRFGTEGWEGKNAKGPFHRYFRFKVVSDESNKNYLAIKNAKVWMFSYREMSSEEKLLYNKKLQEIEEDRKKHKWIFDRINRKKKDQPN